MYLHNTYKGMPFTEYCYTVVLLLILKFKMLVLAADEDKSVVQNYLKCVCLK